MLDMVSGPLLPVSMITIKHIEWLLLFKTLRGQGLAPFRSGAHTAAQCSAEQSKPSHECLPVKRAWSSQQFVTAMSVTGWERQAVQSSC